MTRCQYTVARGSGRTGWPDVSTRWLGKTVWSAASVSVRQNWTRGSVSMLATLAVATHLTQRQHLPKELQTGSLVVEHGQPAPWSGLFSSSSAFPAMSLWALPFLCVRVLRM